MTTRPGNLSRSIRRKPGASRVFFRPEQTTTRKREEEQQGQQVHKSAPRRKGAQKCTPPRRHPTRELPQNDPIQEEIIPPLHDRGPMSPLDLLQNPHPDRARLALESPAAAFLRAYRDPPIDRPRLRDMREKGGKSRGKKRERSSQATQAVDQEEGGQAGAYTPPPSRGGIIRV